MSLASFYLDREANQWWHWFAHANQKKKIMWKMFKKELLLQFVSVEYEDANEAIKKLCQMGSFREFLG